MSRYQPAPYADNDYADEPNYGQSYGNSYGNQQQYGGQQHGGYSDEPQEAYNKYGGGRGNSYPMAASNPYASAGSPHGYAAAPKKKRNKWLWIGLPILLLIIIGAVLGGVLGTQLNKDGSSSSSGGSKSSGNSGDSNTGVPSGITDVNTATSTGANGERYLAIATDSYTLPVYATGTNTAGYSAPTVLADASSNGKWPSDPSPPSNTSIRAHPRIGAPAYKWEALTAALIANDPYFKFWNDTIVGNASSTLNDDPEPYVEDGGLTGSGVLDVARRMKVKVKNWSYAYKVTNETKYADRVWLELTTAAGNNSAVSFGADDGTRWNAAHFLDLAEFCATFAIGYDWLYDYWTDDQRDALMWSMMNLGLSFGELALTGDSSASAYDWWTGNPTMINGNWNCVCNGGLIMAALAIVDREPATALAEKILSLAVPNAGANCFQGAWSDGTWSETTDYWYFGNTGAAEMVAALTTAYGDDRGLTTAGPGMALTSLFHMYSYGMTQRYQYGDSGPEKFSSTANALFLWATMYNEPRFALYQRDHQDALEPWSMFWYDPASSGTWWDGLALDRHFNSTEGNWATGRSTWSDNNGALWMMKSGLLTGHQTHGDLDLGDFVIDAMGQRWIGEYGSGQYLSPGYFSSEAQDSERWLYYRKRTEGQNTVLVNYANQLVTATPSANFDSTGTQQGLAPSMNVSTDDTAFYTCDISSGYSNGTTVKRGIRFLNGRRQFLIQDDINVAEGTDVQWRVQTNASVTVNSATATMELGGQTMLATIVNGPSGASFSTASPTPAANQSPAAPTPSTADQKDGDPANPGVTVLLVDNPNGGSYSLEILLNPQWSDMAASDYVTPSSVAIDSWSLTSHN